MYIGANTFAREVIYNFTAINLLHLKNFIWLFIIDYL